ncbi:MAG: hypothetical protein ACYDBJ_29130 [Aggregatilineales bacterium]
MSSLKGQTHATKTSAIPRSWILLALVVVVCVIGAYLLIFTRMCGCAIPVFDGTTTAIVQTNVSVVTAVAGTATANARTPTPTPDPRTATALSQIRATQTAIGRAQTGTPTP